MLTLLYLIAVYVVGRAVARLMIWLVMNGRIPFWFANNVSPLIFAGTVGYIYWVTVGRLW